MITQDRTTDMQRPTKLSLAERRQILRRASMDYLRGQISAGAFADLEQRYQPDYVAALYSLSRRRLSLLAVLATLRRLGDDVRHRLRESKD